MTEGQRKATLKDGQDAGDMLLDIEGRIGEIALKETPSIAHAIDGKFKESGKKPKHERLSMKKTRVLQSQTIHKNPKIVEKVKAQARENEDGFSHKKKPGFLSRLNQTIC